MFHFIERRLEEFAADKKFDMALDIGSFDVNGSVKRTIGDKCRLFTGIDMREGPGVDMVMNGHDILDEWGYEEFDLVTCCETFEHDINFWITLNNMRLVLKRGGWMFISAPGLFFMHHDYPSDYYRFTEEVFKDYFFHDFEDVHIVSYADPEDIPEKPNNTIVGWGRRPS